MQNRLHSVVIGCKREDKIDLEKVTFKQVRMDDVMTVLRAEYSNNNVHSRRTISSSKHGLDSKSHVRRNRRAYYVIFNILVSTAISVPRQPPQS